MNKKQRTRVPESMETQYEEQERDDSIPPHFIPTEEIENDVTFEELKKSRSNGAHVFFQKPKEDRKLKRINKNSSKRAVSSFREVIQAPSKALKKELKKDKDLKRIGEIEERISWIDKQMKSDSMKNIDTEILAKHKKKEREAAKQGKRPFYLKKSFVEKRRRRNAAKDHRYMPYRRSGDVE
ncbi:hypothetical protein PHAVU_009G247000 [Phaseolus vulgaris]|uniref:rRNA biogenesis protein RRP36 n=1 Tax=Phaseolus vulgaris TaxID=3885 RepID=V7B1Z8_PHAVU|nr:hypothetical protein PHAVU_009G247000g [Phaseolus vulgaris]ESW10893.1 hypothetical protein PHAVU_009G247000g [Phaseolus vulgaris]